MTRREQLLRAYYAQQAKSDQAAAAARDQLRATPMHEINRAIYLATLMRDVNPTLAQIINLGMKQLVDVITQRVEEGDLR